MNHGYVAINISVSQGGGSQHSGTIQNNKGNNMHARLWQKKGEGQGGTASWHNKQQTTAAAATATATATTTTTAAAATQQQQKQQQQAHVGLVVCPNRSSSVVLVTVMIRVLRPMADTLQAGSLANKSSLSHSFPGCSKL